MSCLVKLKIIGKWLAVGQLEGATLNYPQITQIGFKNLCNRWKGILRGAEAGTIFRRFDE